MFGYRKSHRFGSGEILLQARSCDAEVIIGRQTIFNNNSGVCATKSIRIGERCLIGDSVMIVDSDFHEINPASRHSSAGPSESVVIGNNVWIGSRAVILKGVTIGDNSVIGAMSLVTDNIPPNCIVAGVPAKVIRQIEQQT
ncbi:MAG: acyltransferase [Verrucomicrobiales bacterium]|nr:MAG: acyltransferase [Verrucomicrobiales bacterium]